MKVTNYIAERGVALMYEFNKIVTNDEEQKQYLLLAGAAEPIGLKRASPSTFESGGG